MATGGRNSCATWTASPTPRSRGSWIFRLERRQTARLEFPNTQVVGRFEEALESDVDAVVIATPIRTHYKLAKQALEQGKHVWSKSH